MSNNSCVAPLYKAIAIAMVIVPTISIAQNNTFKIGLLLGPTIGTMKPSPFFGDFFLYGLAGYDAALTVEIPLLRSFSLCLDIEYINKGYFRNLYIDTSTITDINSYWLQAKRDYFQVPIYINYSIPTNHSIWEPFLQLGLAAAINTKAANETVRDVSDSGITVSTDDLRHHAEFASAYQTLDFPILVGTGVALDFGPFSIWTGMRYMVGLRSFVISSGADYKLTYKTAEAIPGEAGKYEERYNSLSFLIGFTVNIHGQKRITCCPEQ
jgi:hypothetical protein